MQRIGYSLGSQVLLLVLVAGSYAWTNSISSGDEVEGMRRLTYNGMSPRRLLELGDYGRRPFGEEGSYEEASPSASFVADFYNQLEKRAPGKTYSFGLGKRSRSYGFGLGKRLEQAWKNSASSMSPSYRPERRSKIYSFGLGKRGGPYYSSDSFQDDYEEQQQLPLPAADKKSRQFSFGLGKREAKPLNPAS